MDLKENLDKNLDENLAENRQDNVQVEVLHQEMPHKMQMPIQSNEFLAEIKVDNFVRQHLI